MEKEPWDSGFKALRTIWRNLKKLSRIKRIEEKLIPEK